MRTAIWTATWAAVLAAVFHFGSRPRLAYVFGLEALAALLVLPRLRRTGDPPRAARWMAYHALLASLVGAAASGGLASPLTFAAGVAAATTAAFGNPHGVALAFGVPALLHVGDLLGLTGAPLNPAMAGAATFATFGLSVGVVAEYLLGERGSRSALGLERVRSGQLDAQALARDLARAQAILGRLPVGWLTVDTSGRVERTSPRIELEGASPGAELIAVAALANMEPVDLADLRSVLAAWRDGAELPSLLARLPARFGERSIRYTALEEPAGTRLLVAVATAEAATRSPGLDSLHILAVEASTWSEGPVSVAIAADSVSIPVPDTVAGLVGDGLRALVDNAVAHARGRVELRCERRARTVVLSVADDGVGIDWQQVESRAAHAGWATGSRIELEQALLRPGLSTRGRSGLGLARARAAAESLGGRIVMAETAEGEGSVFELHVPRPIPRRAVVRDPATASASDPG